MSLPSYAVTLRGKPACPCDAEWIPAFEEELLEQGIITKALTIAQLIGMASASALVHSRGGAGDVWETDERIAFVARQMGAVAWPRVTGSFATNRHTHWVLIGCPHLHQQGLDQITEAYAGGDGLIGDVPDDSALHAALWPKRTWQEGIAWHREQQLFRRRVVKLEKARARQAKWTRWKARNRKNIARLAKLTKRPAA